MPGSLTKQAPVMIFIEPYRGPRMTRFIHPIPTRAGVAVLLVGFLIGACGCGGNDTAPTNQADIDRQMKEAEDMSRKERANQ